MKKSFILVLVTFFAFSCSKNESTPATPTPDQLPAITTTGANTAGCLIIDKVLIPKNGSQAIGGPALYGLEYDLGFNFGNPNFNEYFAFRIKNLKETGGDDIYVHFNEMIQGTGIYNVGQSNGDYYIASPNNHHIILKRNINTSNEKTYLSSPNSGTITVSRFDYPNKIISGEFTCSLYNVDNPTEKIQVTNGRFDINLITLNR